MDPAVEVADLVKTFPAPGGGTLTAVGGISFTVERGEIFGFLGPNSRIIYYGTQRVRRARVIAAAAGVFALARVARAWRVCRPISL